MNPFLTGWNDEIKEKVAQLIRERAPLPTLPPKPVEREYIKVKEQILISPSELRPDDEVIEEVWVEEVEEQLYFSLNREITVREKKLRVWRWSYDVANWDEVKHYINESIKWWNNLPLEYKYYCLLITSHVLFQGCPECKREELWWCEKLRWGRMEECVFLGHHEGHSALRFVPLFGIEYIVESVRKFFALD